MKYILIRDVLAKDHHWLSEDHRKGDIVYSYGGATYGCITEQGAAFTKEDGIPPFFELPSDSVMRRDSLLVKRKVVRIIEKEQFEALALELGMRDDWHEPDEQEITVEVRGNNFDNAGFWPETHAAGQTKIAKTFTAGGQEEIFPQVIEMFVVIKQDKQPVAIVNLASLCAWASTPSR